MDWLCPLESTLPVGSAALLAGPLLKPALEEVELDVDEGWWDVVGIAGGSEVDVFDVVEVLVLVLEGGGGGDEEEVVCGGGS